MVNVHSVTKYSIQNIVLTDNILIIKYLNRFEERNDGFRITIIAEDFQAIWRWVGRDVDGSAFDEWMITYWKKNYIVNH